MQNIILASDHAGFKLKKEIKSFLIKNKKKVLDLGTNSPESVDYPDFAHRLCYNIKSAKLCREHNIANVMTIGARFTKKKLALKCVDAFIKTNFKGGRHLRRVKKI